MDITIAAYLAVVVGLPVAPADANASLVGTWRAQLSQEVKEAAQKLHIPEPVTQLVLNTDSTFLYSSAVGGLSRVVKGRFVPAATGFSLIPTTTSEDWPAQGLLANLTTDPIGLTLAGTTFSKVPNFDVTGTWVLTTPTGTPDTTTKAVFGKDGKFAFRMSAGESGGTYKVDAWDIVLTYTTADGVDFRRPVEKRLKIGEDGSFFLVDAFRYMKADAVQIAKSQ